VAADVTPSPTVVNAFQTMVVARGRYKKLVDVKEDPHTFKCAQLQLPARGRGGDDDGDSVGSATDLTQRMVSQ
jgi:hypothetical protein